MPSPIKIESSGRTPEDLVKMGLKCKCGGEARRLFAVAAVLRGAPRQDAAFAFGVDRQTVRDWVARFSEEGPDGLRSRARGAGCRLNDAQTVAVARVVEEGPDPQRDGVARWRLCDLRDWIEESFGVKYSAEGVRRLIRRLGFRHVSPRPFHPKADRAAQEKFRREFKELAMECVPKGVDPGKVEIWFQDEARAGQKGMLSRLWARRGTRPDIVRDHRYGYCYLFSAACPRRGTSAGHVCDRANTAQMNLHLAEISRQVREGGHAVVVLDGAGWHRSKDLEIPKDVSLLRLPPYSPELNSMENVFGYLKSNKLANRLFDTAEDVREAVLDAWTEFAEQPDRIASIMTREWAAFPN